MPALRVSQDTNSMNDYQDDHHAHNTKVAYSSAVRRFVKHCDASGVAALPCEPRVLADYLADLADRGLRPSSINLARCAIDRAHFDAGHSKPGTHREVINTIKGINRKLGSAKRQKAGLTADIFNRILERATGEQYGEILTIIAVMRDGLLRSSELVALQVNDFTAMPDGSGRLTIKRSKTDKTGEGAVQYLSIQTAAMVARHCDRLGRIDGYLFGRKTKPLPARTLRHRIKALVMMAGIDPTNYSTHSPRIGMACDLVSGGQSSVAVAQAGRWSTTTQPINYTRSERAGRGAVAKYYQSIEGLML